MMVSAQLRITHSWSVFSFQFSDVGAAVLFRHRRCASSAESFPTGRVKPRSEQLKTEN
jgi:hypothetical protein